MGFGSVLKGAAMGALGGIGGGKGGIIGGAIKGALGGGGGGDTSKVPSSGSGPLGGPAPGGGMYARQFSAGDAAPMKKRTVKAARSFSGRR